MYASSSPRMSVSWWSGATPRRSGGCGVNYAAIDEHLAAAERQTFREPVTSSRPLGGCHAFHPMSRAGRRGR